MAKSPKKAWHKAKHDNVPKEKDDGTRWRILRAGTPVYPSSEGLPRQEAERLAGGLQEPADVVQMMPS